MDEATLKGLMEPLGLHDDAFELDGVVGLVELFVKMSRRHQRYDDLAVMLTDMAAEAPDGQPQHAAAFLRAIFADFPEVREPCINLIKDQMPELLTLLE